MSTALADWLLLLEQRHPRAIDMGLERCQAVWERMAVAERLAPAITIAGTNGKGTTSSALVSIAKAHGLRVGLYQSPHLVRYNERVQVLGEPASDQALVDAFDAVETARGHTGLTYFETGTLAALWLFSQHPLDLIVLEVGLGGRLDAVNIIAAEVSVLTSIGQDHQEWLGSDRVAIGREKIGIARSGKPWVCAERALPEEVLATVAKLGATPLLLGVDFHCVALTAEAEGRLTYSVSLAKTDFQPRGKAETLHFMNLDTRGFVASNIAAALQALQCWGLALQDAAVREGVASLQLLGRQQFIGRQPDVIVDVAHNAQAAQALAERLQQDRCEGTTYALFGLMDDKPVCDVIAPLLGVVERWSVADLQAITPRAASVGKLTDCLQHAGATLNSVKGGLVQQFRSLCQDLRSVDRLVIWGSFHLVGPILAMQEKH